MDENKVNPEEVKEGVLFDDTKHVAIGEIIICLKRSDQGPMLYLRPTSRIEMVNALGEIQIAITRAIMDYDAENMKARQIQIVPAKGGMIAAARNRLFRGK
jgi:hypothetical protein